MPKETVPKETVPEEPAPEEPAPKEAARERSLTTHAVHREVDEPVEPYVVSEHIPVGVRVAAGWSWRMILIAAVVYGVFWLVLFFAPVTVPFMLAVLLSALLAPVVNGLEKIKAPRGVAVAITLLGALAAIIGGLAAVGTQLSEGIAELGQQASTGVGELVSKAERVLPGNVRDQMEEFWVKMAEGSGGQSSVIATAWSVTGTAGTVGTGFLLMFFCAIFLLYDGRSIWLWAVRLIPAPARKSIDRAAMKGWVTLASFVRATMVVAMADAIGIGIGAALLDVPLVVPIMVLVFFSSFVPVVGAFVSGAVAVLVAFVSHDIAVALLMLLVVVAVQQLEAHVMQPLLLGRAVSIHPIAVVMSIGAGMLVGGFLGALFAVPLIALTNTMLSELLGTGDDTFDDSSGGILSPGGDADYTDGRELTEDGTEVVPTDSSAKDDKIAKGDESGKSSDAQ